MPVARVSFTVTIIRQIRARNGFGLSLRTQNSSTGSTVSEVAYLFVFVGLKYYRPGERPIHRRCLLGY